MAGGIFGFLGLVSAHRGAVEYDWRTRFGSGLRSIGVDMSLQEAARLAKTLLADPSSATAASLQGWSHPISREALVLMDLFDLDHQVAAGKKVKPHTGRPEKSANVERKGDVSGRTNEEVRDILRQARDGLLRMEER